MNDYSTKNVSIDNLHGKIEFRLTNDYLFRAVFQTNPVALKGLLCALLHLNENDIKKIEILNPIELGKSVTDKEFRLDIKILLNDDHIINIELQVENKGNWKERSLSYTCRMYDNLNRGANYKNVTPVMHIGILDFTLFEDNPEFYSSYLFCNEKSHKVYTDSFSIKVLDLTRTDLATDEDKAYNLDKWARLFKATTWEELKFLSKNNRFMEEVTKSMHIMTEDEILREKMIEREEFYADMRWLQERAKAAEVAENRNKELETQIKDLEARIKELTS